MSDSKIKFNKLFLVTGILILSLFFSTKLKAAVISPDKYYIDTNKSVVLEEKLNVYAPPSQDKPITYKIRPIGVRKVGELNDRSFYEVEGTSSTDPVNWINIIDKEITVEPASSVEVRWTLNVPTDYLCLTSLAGIAVSEVNTDNSANGSQVSIQNEVISQVHINTTDTSRANCSYYENLILQEFRTTQNIPVYNYDNIEFKTVIDNQSSYLARNLKGFIEFFGIGNKTALEFNENDLDVYPNSQREFTTLWLDKDYPRDDYFQQVIYEFTHLKIGMYQVRLGITKNIQTPIISTINIFIFPWRVVLITSLILLLLGYGVKTNINNRKELKRLKGKSQNTNRQIKFNAKQL